MVDLDHGPGLAEGLLLGQFLHRKDRAVGHIEGIEGGHHIHLVHGHGPLLDFRKDLIQFVEARLGAVVFRIIEPILMPDDPGQCRKGSGLSDHVNVSVGIGLPAFASDDRAWVAPSGGIARTGYGIAETAVEELRIFLERAAGEPLLVTQLHAA